MKPPSHITVTAPSGVLVPIHPDDGTGPGGVQLRASSEIVIRVRYAGSQSVRRAIARGDLIPCDMDGAAVASAHLAACPAEPAAGCSWLRGRTKATKIATKDAP